MSKITTYTTDLSFHNIYYNYRERTFICGGGVLSVRCVSFLVVGGLDELQRSVDERRVTLGDDTFATAAAIVCAMIAEADILDLATFSRFLGDPPSVPSVSCSGCVTISLSLRFSFLLPVLMMTVTSKVF